jgi:hypothetical protein
MPDDVLRLVRRRSRIAGWASMRRRQSLVTRGSWTKGELVTQAEAWRREQRYLPCGRIWIFTINDRWARDAVFGGNVARYINHACRPNWYLWFVIFPWPAAAVGWGFPFLCSLG